MEHLATIDITSQNAVRFAIPVNGGIRGVYTSAPVTLGYEDNGSVGTMVSNVTLWEPNNGFFPAPEAHLIISPSTNNTKVTIRYVR